LPLADYEFPTQKRIAIQGQHHFVGLEEVLHRIAAIGHAKMPQPNFRVQDPRVDGADFHLRPCDALAGGNQPPADPGV